MAEEQLFQSEERSLKAIFDNPGAREWWSSNPYSFSPEFRSHVDGHLRAVLENAGIEANRTGGGP